MYRFRVWVVKAIAALGVLSMSWLVVDSMPSLPPKQLRAHVMVCDLSLTPPRAVMVPIADAASVRYTTNLNRCT